MLEITRIEQEARKCCQSTLSLILLEHLGFFSDDTPREELKASNSTFQKAMAVAESHGWLATQQQSDYQHRMRALIRHQANYIRRLLDGKLMGTIEDQVEKDPAGYEDYLRGVYETHRGHARTFASQPQFAHATTLVDIGSALGAFSSAWIMSRQDRSAIMMDLPQVLPIIKGSPEYAAIISGKAALQPIDLRSPFDIPLCGDVYLFSNILHLFDDWKRVFKHASAQVPKGKSIVVFEAIRDGSHESCMFDLLTNIRADSRGGLIDVGEIATILDDEWRVETINIGIDPFDFFARQYTLVVCTRQI